MHLWRTRNNEAPEKAKVNGVHIYRYHIQLCPTRAEYEDLLNDLDLNARRNGLKIMILTRGPLNWPAEQRMSGDVLCSKFSLG